MGKLIEGKWNVSSIITSGTDGSYEREERTFRDTISDDHPRFRPQSSRYHLYVSYACPWAHRTLITRSLKKLENHIDVSVVHPDMLENGWTFASDFEGATGDQLYQKQYLYEIYQKADSSVTTSVTVPVLWDKVHQTIVNNESSEIIRIMNVAFNSLTGDDQDFYPPSLRDKIDTINDEVYNNINNGVYRAGFAKKQKAYEQAVNNLFESLDHIENILKSNRFLMGEIFTEADIRLIPTLLRFDIVYFTHFKCNLRRIKDYPNLSRYMKDLYGLNAIRSTTYFDHIKRHYYYSHESLNPCRIIPLGPDKIF